MRLELSSVQDGFRGLAAELQGLKAQLGGVGAAADTTSLAADIAQLHQKLLAMEEWGADSAAVASEVQALKADLNGNGRDSAGEEQWLGGRSRRIQMTNRTINPAHSDHAPRSWA